MFEIDKPLDFIINIISSDLSSITVTSTIYLATAYDSPNLNQLLRVNNCRFQNFRVNLKHRYLYIVKKNAVNYDINFIVKYDRERI